MQRRSVLLVPSDEIGWVAVRDALRSITSITIVGEATNRSSALALAVSHTPNVVLAATWIDGISILPAIAQLASLCPTCTIITFAARFESDELMTMASVGVSGYLLWSDLSCDSLRHCLGTLLSGRFMLGSREPATTFSQMLQDGAVKSAPVSSLSSREQSILRGLAAGLSRDEIAQRECLSKRTVQRIIATMEDKLDAPNPFVLGMRAAYLRMR